MERYSLEKALELIPQSAIKQCYITDSPGFNAAWDYHITPDGRHFIACCAEGAFAEYVRLYEYFPKTNTVEKKFNLDDSIVVYPRTIRPSKFHTSMCDMPDGKIIMATHTTAAAPTHKEWMPEAYYNHMWEGFMGSNVLIYDPKTNTVEDLGIPVPRESIYGAKYIAEHNCYFFITYYRGHAYRLDLDTRNVTDYGQCTEFGSCFLADGPDGNIYFTSRTGALWCFDTKTLAVSYKGVEIPRDTTVRFQSRNLLSYNAIGKDGLLYFTPHPGNHILSYNPKSNEIKSVSKVLPVGLRDYITTTNDVFGMAFDDDGIMWYTVLTPLTEGDPPLRLLSLDITDPNATPVDYGIIGTVDRVHVCIESAVIRDNILYLPDANGAYAPGVAAIDLEVLKRDKDTPRVISTDPKYGKALITDEHLKRKSKPNEYTKNNPFSFRRDTTLYAGKIWKALGTEGSQVEALEFDGDANVIAYTKKDGGTAVTLREGEILKIEKRAIAPKESKEEIAERFAAFKLPSHPGRQFLAVANAYAEMENGVTIVGTKDGCVALINNGKVFSLGIVCNDGAVHDIAVSPDGKRAVGVAGDPYSLGIVFTYDAENGLNVEGFTYYMNGCGKDRLASVSCEPCCVAFSHDGKRLAIGVRDKLGCVYEYEID